MILFYIAGWIALGVMLMAIAIELYILPKYHEAMGIVADEWLVISYALFFIACVVTL